MTELREAIKEAFTDDVEEIPSEVIKPVEEHEEGPDVEAAEGSAVEEIPVDEPDTQAQATDDAPVDLGEEPPAEDTEKRSGSDEKPPLGWAADAREEWGKIPAAAQAQIAKREKEMAQAMAHTAEAKRAYSELEQIGQTYGSVMAAEGARTPMEAINGLMQTVSQLRLGSPEQKAQKMAQLISHYGVDIGALDSVLSGEPVQAPEVSQFEQVLDQRLAPVNEMMNNLAGMQQQKQQQSSQAIQQELDNFAKGAEFLNDVRMDMADILDLAKQRGQEMGLQEAYDRACMFNPTVSKVIEARKQASTLQKRAASSSVVGSGGSVKPTKDMSIADQIREAWPD